MSVTAYQRTVYRAPTAGRSYLTKRAAIYAEAKALIQERHPTERPESDENGRQYFSGWYWRDLPRSEVLLRRVMRLVKRAMEPQQSNET